MAAATLFEPCGSPRCPQYKLSIHGPQNTDESEVDVCFSIDLHHTNDVMVKQFGFYQNSFHAYGFPADSFLKHIQAAQIIGEEKRSNL